MVWPDLSVSLSVSDIAVQVTIFTPLSTASQIHSDQQYIVLTVTNTLYRIYAMYTKSVSRIVKEIRLVIKFYCFCHFGG